MKIQDEMAPREDRFKDEVEEDEHYKVHFCGRMIEMTIDEETGEPQEMISAGEEIAFVQPNQRYLM